MFKSKKIKLIALLSTLVVTLSAATIISTLAWFVQDVSIGPVENMPSSILTGYFDKNDLPTGFDETQPNHQHGSAANPYVITRPIHYYNLVRLQQLGTYNFNENTYFQFGKQFGMPSGLTEQEQSAYPYLFYKYNDNGVLIKNQYDTHLNMKYYSSDNPRAPKLSPIGSARYPFEAHIIGKNTTVSNLDITGKDFCDIGIFGYVAKTATIENLYFDGVSIDCANGDRYALGSLGHVHHESHIYVGYLAGHVYDTHRFNNVYLNNCIIKNTSPNTCELINTYGFFGHTDEPTGSSEDSSSYTSQLVAKNAYEALSYTHSTGKNEPLSLRYTSENNAGKFLRDAVAKDTTNNSDNFYTIGQNSQTSKPYSLSSIGYASGDGGSTSYIRYIKNVNGEDRYEEITNVDPNNILTEKPQWIEEPEDENEDPVVHDFYGMEDGAYVYFDQETEKWMYADVVGIGDEDSNGHITLNCFTISYTQTIGNTTKTYYLEYVDDTYDGHEEPNYYDKLVPHEWTGSQPPAADQLQYYFCFKESFGARGASRFTECSVENEYYIYSPFGKKYLCTYSPQNTNNSAPYVNANLVHTPVFVPQEGVESTNGEMHMPMKFTVNGPKTQITYTSHECKESGSSANVNTAFNESAGKVDRFVGALQGSNLTDNNNQFNVFGGHKMTANAPGGVFTIGEYIADQTTTLTDAINYKLTSQSSEIKQDTTFVIAGYKGEQESTYSLDYAMGGQAQNQRLAIQVKEVRDSSGYVLNDTSGVAKLTIDFVSDGVFTLYDGSGYLCFPKTSAGFTGGVGNDKGTNMLRTYDYSFIHEEGHETRIPYSQWKFEKYEQNGYYTRYRFQNVGDPDRYLCYNIQGTNSTPDGLFSCYSLSYYNDKYGANGFDNNNVAVDPNTGYPNVRCWFYIYKQQFGQTIQNVHYTIPNEVNVPTTILREKQVNAYELLGLGTDTGREPTDYGYYEPFDVNPSFNVYFDTTQSKVEYFNTLIEVWKKVNIISEIEDGDQVMIAAQTNSGGGNTDPTHYFMGSQANNYRNRSSSIQFAPPYVKDSNVPTNAVRLTLVRSNRGWRFDTGDGFLYSPGGGNYLRTKQTPDSNGNSDFSIAILGDGTAQIRCLGSNNNYKYMHYTSSNSWWSSTGYFACFNNDNYTAIQLYRLAQSSADRATYVADLINNFEPQRMDAVGPNIDYHSTYMVMNSAPTQISQFSTGNREEHIDGDLYYPSIYFKNAITLLIDNNGSRDLGTLTFECNSSTGIPYFYLPTGTTTSLVQERAIDKSDDGDNNTHTYVLNINASNIQRFTYAYIKGDGTGAAEYKFCEEDDEDMSEYLIILGAPSGVQITNVTFTFNAVPGNIGYPGAVDYRTASYDANGVFNGSVQGGQMVEETVICIYYDMNKLNQQMSIRVVFSNNTYYIYIDTTNMTFTQPLTVNIFKYDNDATALIVNVNGIETEYFEGTVSIVVQPEEPETP